ncbi:hypothetical protein [uncultured Jatrophihabitans sp.]|uniref:hypothetical protein n=1 Tax=uncultured Jatrophihabitans sp. TaxID=1610747 RepID=UPI0035C99536
MSMEPGQPSPADADAVVADGRDVPSPVAETQGAAPQAETLDAKPAAHADLVERADAELSSLDELPLAAHPEVYARIHETLNRELADIDGA